ncbi:MAG TPA: GGDEF domain-containing protein [Accumulibacter sp.]|nr:GGDEF domain-containing protein [Accumulibacter sp.]HND79227.1 GGDEF domain-containing protein [Accumulibacter sp.]HNE12093.1 GGDEF domain-containing protein [Accumulibacter sp.]HNG39375.1 GGDEF domain-containing protein [Accumulibacter sp.]HNH24295.1 GGDEF domain-containing protein [Accumulibacter sp.]
MIDVRPLPCRQPLERPKSATVFLELASAQQRINELEQALHEARAAALTDPLTGALNRRGFDEACRRESARARRKGVRIALAMIDLDDFKKINDEFGHAIGDEALIHLVRTLRNALRPTDILCRFGGEEFVVLLPETRRCDAAAAITRIQRRFSAKTLPGTDIQVTFSAGVVVQDYDESLDDTLARVDAATYSAKRNGKNCVVTG